MLKQTLKPSVYEVLFYGLRGLHSNLNLNPLKGDFYYQMSALICYMVTKKSNANCIYTSNCHKSLLAFMWSCVYVYQIRIQISSPFSHIVVCSQHVRKMSV